MNATGKRRLLKLADFLETKVPTERFEMDCWGTGKDRGGTLECGSAACALGWATAIPELNRAGVQFARPSAEHVFTRRREPSQVAAEVFGMSYAQFEKIFLPDDRAALRGRRGARIVAKRIRKLVASQSSKPA